MPTTRALHGHSSRERDEMASLVAEATKTLVRTIGRLSRSARRQLVEEGNGAHILLETVLHPSILESTRTRSPWLPALLRGVEQRRILLQSEGGSLSGEEVAKALGISRQAVDKQRRRGQLLAVRAGGTWRYPAWQLADGAALPHLAAVMRVLHQQSPWTIMAFLLSRNVRLASRRPLDLLRKGTADSVLRAAEAYGEHGAA